MASTENLMSKAADILVADDEIASLRLLTEILTKEGYQVRPAEQPQLALESALAHPPSLILLDVKMPEMSGFEVCRRLKQDERTREVPIIFISALQELQDRIQGFEVGGVDFILKPIQEQEVLARVKTHLQLRNAQLHLEGLVAERTAALERANDELRSSEKRFKDVADNTLGWIWEVDNNGKYTYASPTVERVLGYKPEEILQKHFCDLFYPDDKEELKRAASEVFASNEMFREFANRNVHKNGKVIWLSTSGVPIYDERGEHLGYRGADTDITERKFAETQLRENEQQLSAIVRSSSDHMSMLDRDHNIVWANHVAKRMFGQDLMGKKCYASFHGRETICDGCVVSKVFDDGQVHEHTKEVIDKDGSERIFWCTANAAAHDENGTPSLVVEVSRDITEHKLADEALEQSEEKFRTLVTNTEEIVYMIAKDGTFLLSEGKGLSKLGLKPGEVVGESVFELYENYPYMLDSMRKAFNGETMTIEVNVDGNHLKNWYTPQKDNEGEIIGLLGLSVNITEQMQTEQKLRASEERFRATFDQAAVGIDLEALDGGILRINQKFCDIVGYSQDEMLERSFQDITHPDDLDMDEKYAQRMLDGQLESYSTEKRYLRKNGEIVWANVTVSLVRGQIGEPDYFISVVEDITERKQAEQALQKSEKRFKDVADNASEWIWEVDNNGKYTYVSPVVERILGYKPEEILQKHFYDLFYPDDKEELKRAAFEAFASKESFHEFINQNVHKNGRVVWLSTSGMPIFDERGEFDGYRGADTDITERKRAEEMLKAELVYHREDLSVLVQRHSLAVKISSFGIWDWDIQENTMTWDNKLFEIYGIEKKFPLPYEDWVHLIHPDDLPTVEANMQRVIETRSEASLDFRIVQPDGELRHISAAGTVVLNDAGEVVKAIGINLDITERTQAEDALQESESLLRTIADNYPAYLAIIIKGEQDFVVDFSSGRELERQNLDPSSFNGKMLGEIFGDQAAFVRENYERAFMGEEVTFELFHNDQYQLYHAIPLINEENKGIDRILVVVDVIDDRKMLEAKIKETAAMAERDRLARNLHDAVTQTIFSASAIAEATPLIWDKDEAAGRQYLDQLPILLRGALAEMRILLLELRPGALGDQTLGLLLDPLVDAARAQTHATITSKVEGDRALPEDVTRALHRIVQECLNNIAKHAEASQVNIWLCFNREGVELQISDDGRGFDPGSIPPGHLGVDIMRDRARKIGAAFNIDSEPGRGTIVVVTWSDPAQSIS